MGDDESKIYSTLQMLTETHECCWGHGGKEEVMGRLRAQTHMGMFDEAKTATTMWDTP